ncbi:MAG TPA: phage portal protein [Phycisphaerae bacterium]|nr:phage portal protein [Phycisphaerae bacterium]
MGVLTRILAQSYTMEDFDRQVLSRIRGGLSHAGVQVSESTAMRLIDVYACVRVIAETMGSLPVSIYRRRPTGGADKVPDHPVTRLLTIEPNPDMTGQTMVETVTANCAISGNGYAVITPDMSGRPADLYPYQWTQVEPERDPETERIWYRVTTDDGEWMLLPAERVLHIPGFSFDGLKGLSPIAHAAEMVGIGLATQEFLARFYGQGMNVGGVLEHPGKLSDKARANLIADLEAKGAGLANSWRPLVLEEGMKFNRIPMPLRDAQTVEMLKLTRDQIAALFRVPPHMIANLERATFSNIEHQSLEFVKYTMLPWIVRWEREINRKLFTRREKEQGYYVKFNVEGLLRGDYKSRQEGLAIQRQNGIINADEWRELEEMNPIPDGSGKVYLVNGNMRPISEVVRPEGSGGENGA